MGDTWSTQKMFSGCPCRWYRAEASPQAGFFSDTAGARAMKKGLSQPGLP